MKKILIALGIIIILGGVTWWGLQQRGVAPLPAGQTPVDTSEWKTYRNEKYGFEVKYPSSLFAKTDSSSLVLFHEEPKLATEYPGIFIGVDDNPNNLSLKEYYDGDPGRDYFNHTEAGGISERNVAGIVATQFIPYVTFAGEIDVIVPADHKFIVIADDGGTFHANGLFDQILSTFKFTK